MDMDLLSTIFVEVREKVLPTQRVLVITKEFPTSIRVPEDLEIRVAGYEELSSVFSASLSENRLSEFNECIAIILDPPSPVLDYECVIENLRRSGIKRIALPIFLLWEEHGQKFLEKLILSLYYNGFSIDFSGEALLSMLIWFELTTHSSGENWSATLFSVIMRIADLHQFIRQQNDLLIEYRKSLMNDQAIIDFLNEQVVSLEQRWQAFWESRTGRVLLGIKALRERLLPSQSVRFRIARFILRGVLFIRREGLGYAIRITGRRLKRRVKTFWIKMRLTSKGRESWGEYLEMEAVVKRPEPPQHNETVDIIVCVHNALDDVKRCLASILDNTSDPYQLIIVDDGSGTETASYLREFSLKNQSRVVLIRNEIARGYTYAANQGLKASKSDFVVLLNSDTVVTPHWIDRLIGCANSSPKIGIVGPLSNTASWQSVPQVSKNGDWALNPLPHDFGIKSVGELVGRYSARLYPPMPLLNGFCLLIKREFIDQIGYFDEENFGPGYGEEDDLVLRGRKAGWQMALADDVYIYHAQSRSYTDEKRKSLAMRAGRILREKHGVQILEESVEYCLNSPVLEGIRARFSVMFDRERAIERGKRYAGKRILYLLPVEAPGGGANIVVLESMAMRKMGVHIEFLNLPHYREGFTKGYPDLDIPVLFAHPAIISDIYQDFDAIIATHNSTVQWLLPLLNNNKSKTRLGYYIQGFEPLIYEKSTKGYQAALASYTLIPDMVCFTKTEWTRSQVLQYTGRNSEIIGISVDIDLFRPRPWQSSFEIRNRYPIRIAAMVRPESPYREPEKTMRLLKMAYDKYGRLVEPIIFGTTPNNPGFLELTNDFPWKLYGVIPSSKVAALLNSADIFVDYSSHQAMGLTALEAMATGCAVIVPKEGGATSFCVHETNGLVVDTSNFEEVWLALQRLIEDEQLRVRLGKQAIWDACQYYPEKSALNILRVLFGDD